MKPVDTETGVLSAYFASRAGLNGTDTTAPFVDLLVLNHWSDSSGGKVNALAFDKSTAALYHYQAAQGDTTWGTAHPIAYTTSNVASATKLAAARKIDGVNFDGSADISHYGTCSTAAATVQKDVACTGFNLVAGARIVVKFTTTNSATSPTLNVGGTGAKAIQYRGAAITPSYLAANRTYEFIYDGTNYQLVGDINTDANTDTKVTNTLSPTTKAYITGTTSAETNTGTQVFDTGVYLDTTAGVLVATTFKGALSGNATTATSAGKLTTGHKIGLSGVTATAQTFNGSGDITIPITAVPATLITGTVASATNATNATKAGTADKLSTARSINISDASGAHTGTAISFDGSAGGTIKLPATITATLVGNADTATKATSADKLTTARTIGVSGVTGTAQSFDGSKNIVIPITAVPATLLTGTAKVNTTGSAAKLTTPRYIYLVGDVTGNTTFDGSENVEIETSLNYEIKTVTTQPTGLTCELPLDLHGNHTVAECQQALKDWYTKQYGDGYYVSYDSSTPDAQHRYLMTVRESSTTHAVQNYYVNAWTLEITEA